MKATELIDGGLYKVGADIVRFDAVFGFYGLDGERYGYLTHFQRSKEIACRIGTKRKDIGYDWKNEHIKGIPLTSEILEKNGFRYEKDYGSYYRSTLGDYAKDKEPLVAIQWNSKGKVCQWEVVHKKGINEGASAYGYNEIAVHELQKTLLVCGLEELAINFKI